VFVYATKNLLGHVGRVIAQGEVTSPLQRKRVSVGQGLHFRCWCSLRLSSKAPEGEGLALKPIVNDLTFMRKKENRPHYL
jgi:hypothetical protein